GQARLRPSSTSSTARRAGTTLGGVDGDGAATALPDPPSAAVVEYADSGGSCGPPREGPRRFRAARPVNRTGRTCKSYTRAKRSRGSPAPVAAGVGEED